MQGGFIWDWVDQGLYAKDENGKIYWAYGGDLGGEKYHNDENFCCNGLVFWNRIPHPGSSEVKKTYQYIRFTAKNLDNGFFTVKNMYDFTNLNNFYFKWELMKNSKKEAEGKFNLDLLPKAEKEIKITHPALQYEPGTEYFLNIYAYTIKATDIIPDGFEVAREQFSYQENNYFTPLAAASGKPIINADNNRIKIEAGKVILVLNKQTGALESYKILRKNLIDKGPEINFWRAPTDNDFGNDMQRKSNIWRYAGESKRMKEFLIKEENSEVVITVKYLLADIASEYTITYSVNGDGALKIEADYQAGSNSLPEMPRFGMLFTLPIEMDNIKYYGRGPWENYSDRKFSSFIGEYQYKVSGQTIPYVRPQEYGNRTDVRWFILTDQTGKGIRIDGLQPLNISALNNSPEDLDPGFTKKQQHPKDIFKRFDITLAIDLSQRGLGGDNSWGALPHPVYRLLDKSYKYGFVISPVENLIQK